MDTSEADSYTVETLAAFAHALHGDAGAVAIRPALERVAEAIAAVRDYPLAWEVEPATGFNPGDLPDDSRSLHW